MYLVLAVTTYLMGKFLVPLMLVLIWVCYLERNAAKVLECFQRT